MKRIEDDPLKKGHHHDNYNLFRDKHFWIIILVLVLGILSHIFLPHNTPSWGDVKSETKQSVTNFFHGNSSSNEKSDDGMYQMGQ